MAEENTEEEGKKSNLMLYIGIGVGGVLYTAMAINLLQGLLKPR